MAGSKQLVKDGAGEVRIGADEARAGLGEILDRCWDGERVVITRHDRERAVVLGWRDYQKLIAKVA